MEQNSPHNEVEILESQLRENYGKIVYSHKTQEKCADLLTSRNNKIKNAQIILSALKISFTLSVMIGSIPIRSSAKDTERMLPALYFMITVFIYRIPFVEGKLILFISLLTAIFIAFARALKIASILWCSFWPSALIFKLHLLASLNDLKK